MASSRTPLGGLLLITILLSAFPHLNYADTLYVTPTADASNKDCTSPATPCALATAIQIAPSGSDLDLSGNFGPDQYSAAGLAITQLELNIISSKLNAQFYVPATVATLPDTPPQIFSITTEFSTIRFEGLTFTDAPEAKDKGGTSFPPTPKIAVVWNAIAIMSSSDVIVKSCTFRDITIPSPDMYTANIGRIVVVGAKAEMPSVQISHCTFTNLQNVTAVYYGGAQHVDADTNDETILDFMLVVDNCHFEGNTNVGEALIWFQDGDTGATLHDFSVEITSNVSFINNNARMIGGKMPLTFNDTGIVALIDVEISDNIFNATYEKDGFGFVEITYASQVNVSNIYATNNTLLGGPKSYVDPTLFAVFQVDFSLKNHIYNAEIVDSLFTFNQNANPILFNCQRKTPTNMAVRRCIFHNNTVAVTASVSAIGTAPDSYLLMEDNKYENNNVTDVKVLTDWNLGNGAFITCDGGGQVDIYGNATDFGPLGKMRGIYGSCKKRCTGFDATEMDEVCGVTGTTMSTYVMSGLVCAVILGLVIYHIFYVVTKKKEEDPEQYGELNSALLDNGYD